MGCIESRSITKNSTVIWNGYEVSLEDIVRGFEFPSHPEFGLVFIPTLQHVASIESERQRYQDNTMKSDLLVILKRHQRCEATDNRDKLFCIRGFDNHFAVRIQDRRY